MRRRKQLEYTTPLSATAGVGSIISLDKCKFDLTNDQSYMLL